MIKSFKFRAVMMEDYRDMESVAQSFHMISFLAVIVLTKVYMGVYQETRKKDRKKDTPEEENAHES